MNYEITKLYRRHAWYGQFAYMIEFRRSPSWAVGARAGTGVLDFDRCRKWMNESWGWSQDVETRAEKIKSKANVPTEPNNGTDINRHWAWSCRYQEYRIYVDESALTMFKLKWTQDATA
jgi:hypothetical protein